MRQQSPVEMWMRTGLWPELEHGTIERKFNPWHDPEDGRFTFAGQGRRFGSGRSVAARPTTVARPPRTASPRTDGPSPRAMRAQIERIAREGRERDAFKKLVVPEEGDRNDVYIDTNGNATVGTGHKIIAADGLQRGGRIIDAQKDAFWRADADRALRAARSQMRMAGITEARFLLPLASVNFQLGDRWFNKFPKTWAYIRAGRYADAAREAEDSKWFREDSPKRVRAFQAALMRLAKSQQAKRQTRR